MKNASQHSDASFFPVGKHLEDLCSPYSSAENFYFVLLIISVICASVTGLFCAETA